MLVSVFYSILKPPQKEAFFMGDKKIIAIQGIIGSFHHEAAHHLFGKREEILPCQTFDDVIQSVTLKKATYGIMAIENSLAGSIISNYKLLRHSGLVICGEVGLKIHLQVLGLKGILMENITEVHSHPIALRQCAHFLSQYPHIKIVETFDTAGSAKYIQESQLKKVVAIAGKLASSIYNMDIMFSEIQDHEMNFTRFLALKRVNTQPISEVINKISVYFETGHKAGSLAKILNVISEYKINLGKLQSYPIPSKNYLYGFYATFDVNDIQRKQLKEALRLFTTYHQILGEYKKGETYE